jgi:hypothetical protein
LTATLGNPEGWSHALVMPVAEQLDPVTLSLLNAPVDDEPLTVEELRAIEETKASLRTGEPTISIEDFAKEMGIEL